MLLTTDLYNIDCVPEVLRPLLDVTYPWEVLKKLDDFTATIRDHRAGEVHPTAVLEGNIYLHETASIGPHAYVEGPAWIGEGATVGHGAYVRGGVVLAPNAKVGHATEVKRSLFLVDAKAPHLNYVGDSVLGHKVNIGDDGLSRCDVARHYSCGFGCQNAPSVGNHSEDLKLQN